MGGGSSVETSPCLEAWKVEAAKEPDDFSDLPTEEALKAELSRLRRKIRKQMNMVSSTDDSDTALDREIHSLLEKAHAVEEWLTPMLLEIASSQTECHLTGLQFKFKSFHSLKRKIQGNFKTRERQMSRNKHRGGGLDIGACVQAVSDCLRYTFLVTAPHYTTAVVALRERLQEGGMFFSSDRKNYWSEGDMYQGINDVFREQKSGLHVELQYHTPGSWQLKSEAHTLYEQFRICSEPLEQQRLFSQGVQLAASLPVPPGVHSLPRLTRKPAPRLLEAFSSQIVTASTAVKRGLLAWCRGACPLALSVEASVDTEQIIALELSALMSLADWDLLQAVAAYHDGFSVTVVSSAEDYARVISELCALFQAGAQFLRGAEGEVPVKITAARNSYDKEKHGEDVVEGVRLHLVIGSQESSSVYDNIRCHLLFYTPASLETERRVELLSRLLVSNPSIHGTADEIRDLWLACPDPPGSSHIPALDFLPDMPETAKPVAAT